MRVTRLGAVLIASGLTACSPAQGDPTETAIYVSPARSSGPGSAMLLPIARNNPDKEDEAILRVVLARVGLPGSCVAPVLGYPPFAFLRKEMADDSDPATDTPAGRAAFVRARMGSWRDQHGPVDAALESRLFEAAAAIVEHDRQLRPAPASARRSAGPTLRSAWLAPGQSLGERPNCTRIGVSEVARFGTLAFVDVEIVHGPLAGSGERWALELSHGVWKLVAANKLWIS